MQIIINYHNTAIGELIIGSFADKLCLLDFRYRKKRDMVDLRLKHGLNANFVIGNNEILQQTKSQINEYLVNIRQKFTLKFLIIGSDFQQQVWRQLLKIPYGETISYLQLAQNINRPKAVRAVANANGANAISLLIPCHRVIASNNTLGGYGGGLIAKKHLLTLEKLKPLH